MTSDFVPWNLDQRVGPRAHFTPPDVCTLADWFRRTSAWHDLCLFTLGIDSMLRCGDLLSLRVRDVCDRYGVVQEAFLVGQEKTAREVAPALTVTARDACQRWIEISNKQSKDFLFTGSKDRDAHHINDDSYRKRVKTWAEVLRLNAEDYSTHSLRRSKPHFMYRRGVKIEYISELLGHKNTATTYRYLGITREEAQAEAIKHDIFKRSKHRVPKRRHGSVRLCAETDIFSASFDELRSEILAMRDQLRRIETEQIEFHADHAKQIQAILAAISIDPSRVD